MPPRVVCVAILLYWVVAASSLIRRDLLPELRFGRPPDLLAIARAVRSNGPSRWSVQVIDDPAHPEIRRTVGHAVTESIHQTDGAVLLSSNVRFDSGGLLRGTAFASRAHVELEISSNCMIDHSGNLQSFYASVRSEADPQEVLRVEGRLNAQGDALEINARGPLPIMNQSRKIPYQERSLVQNALEPFEYLPGLQVGQRWESRVVNPLTGRIETVRVEVTRKALIHWDGHPVTALEVVQHLTPPLTAKTWVRSDGLVLRQEVPFPLVKLVLERAVDPEQDPMTRGQAQDTTTMIELRGVTKTFGSKVAVDGLDLRIRPGELFAFLGPNGAGKTTTIKMVCGLLAPTTGIVRVGGYPTSSQEARQLLAYVPDQPFLYEKLTGREFLRFVVDMYGIERQGAERRIGELIDTFEMADYVDDLSESYSQGMKQRIVFASALVHEPKVLVVDEPLVGLDPRSARIVKNLFVAQARSGVAVLMSTHLLTIAEELADTIGIIDHGRMLAIGTLAELRARVKQHGPLKDLFLTLTAGGLPPSSGPGAVRPADRAMVPQGDPRP